MSLWPLLLIVHFSVSFFFTPLIPIDHKRLGFRSKTWYFPPSRHDFTSRGCDHQNDGRFRGVSEAVHGPVSLGLPVFETVDVQDGLFQASLIRVFISSCLII